MEERLEDRSGPGRPVLVVFGAEFLARPLGNYFEEPWVQRATGRKALEEPDDVNRCVLKTENLVALMVEAVDGIFVIPVRGIFLESGDQFRPALPESLH